MASLFSFVGDGIPIFLITSQSSQSSLDKNFLPRDLACDDEIMLPDVASDVSFPLSD